ncbi:major facilitator superfamily domain-containing protein [Penicillium manginii]|uniref:major facilitator superfamily domain-containing protein n=1 Tax=Penicillium manginii TaxID=203109 RepID=UPI002548B76C|nr:major facilitator superfamily domain-containing protein [Penicillium manginii]KAJ5739469.1 major facilitator superfamily domain-containing protein [Penicillium manginii]
MNSSQHFSKGGSCRDVPFSDGHSASDHTQVSRMHSTIDHDIHDVSFDGDGDPMSPKTLPLVRKWVIVIIVCTGTMCVTCASSIYTTTYPQMNAEMETPSLIAILGLSFFVLGLGLGPLLTSPLSEWYGRRPIYVVAWAFFVIWNIVTAVAKNIETVIISRFFTGFAGGTFLSVSGGTVSDVFLRSQIQLPMTLVSSAPFIGPCLGPLIGGFISYNTTWRWNYYFIIIWSGVLLVSIAIFVPETFPPVLLRAKAVMLRKSTGDDRYKAPTEKLQTSRGKALAYALMRPFQLLFFEPMCLALDVYAALLLGMLYLFFQAIPLMFETTYGWKMWQGGLPFVGIIAGMIVGALSTPLFARIKDHLLEPQEKQTGDIAPEYSLLPAIPAGVLIPVGLFWFGWSLSSNIHWIVPIIGASFFGCGILLAYKGIFTFLVDAYPQYAASALAGNGFVRSSFAAAFPLFGLQMYNKLGYHWATSLLAFLTILMMPFPWIFFKYGKVLRGKSKFALAA